MAEAVVLANPVDICLVKKTCRVVCAHKTVSALHLALFFVELSELSSTLLFLPVYYQFTYFMIVP